MFGDSGDTALNGITIGAEFRIVSPEPQGNEIVRLGEKLVAVPWTANVR
jgi:hypothetical protein